MMNRRLHKNIYYILLSLIIAASSIESGCLPAYAGVLPAAGAAALEGADKTAANTEEHGAGQENGPETEQEKEQQVVLLRTAADIQNLSKYSTVDSYSRDKIYRLENDIDFQGKPFPSIAVFSGTFDGGGHKLINFTINEAGSDIGLFRFVEATGRICNLGVSGNIVPDGSMERVGGIVGTNRGVIEKCTFSGELVAKKAGGGITGKNEEGGVIKNCTNQGRIVATKQAGGVAGRNEGILTNCRNTGTVNATMETVRDITGEESTALSLTEESLMSGDVSKINAAGGIAGSSAGEVDGCVNQGQVGYQHMGYGVGGIVGYNQGRIHGSRNFGVVCGRKNVGGINGQFEPYVELIYEADATDKLRDEADELNDILSRLSDTTGSAMDTTGDNLDSVADQLDSISDTLDANREYYKNRVRDFRSGLGHRMDNMQNTIDDMGMDLSTDKIKNPMNNIRGDIKKIGEEVLNLGGNLSGNSIFSKDNTADAASKVLYAPAALDGEEDPDGQEIPDSQQPSAGQETYDSRQISDAQEASGEPAASEPPVISEAPETFNAPDALSSLPQMPSLSSNQAAAEQIGKEVERLKKGLSNIKDLGGSIDGEMGKVQDAILSYGNELDRFGENAGKLNDQVRDFRLYIREFMDSMDNDLDVTDADMTDKLDTLSDLMRKTKDDIWTSSDEIQDQMDVVRDQLHSMSNTMADGLDELEEKLDPDTDVDSLYTDISDDESVSGNGVITDCSNEGSINADINGGGICGMIGLEMDSDSDFTVEEVGQRSLRYERYARATVLRCKNFGSVKVKNNCAGGIVGRADVGAVIGGENYGAVRAEDGSYAGGIAGKSSYLIRNSYVLCDVTGNDYVGGVSGYGTDAGNNYVMAGIESESGEKTGSIMGECDADGLVSGNYFVDEGVAAINSLTYEAAARGVSYEELLRQEGLPVEFYSFTVQFVADGRVVKKISRTYGEAVDPAEIPQVPDRNGSMGVWEDKDLSFIRRNMVVEAIYSNWTTTIASAEPLPVLLVEGNFYEGTRLEYEQLMDGLPQKAGYAPAAAYRYTVVSDSGVPSGEVTVHVLADDLKKDAAVLTFDGGGQVSQPQAQRDGRYLVFTTADNSFVILEKQGPPLWLLCLIGAALLILIIVAVIKRRGKKRPPAPADETEEPAEETNVEKDEDEN